MDHLIITEYTYVSFADSGGLKEIAKSKKYVLPGKEQERLLKEAKAMGLLEGRKLGVQEGLKTGKQMVVKRELEMARGFKAKGIKAEMIAEVTGLSLAEVKKLKG